MKNILVFRTHQNDAWSAKFDKLQAVASSLGITLQTIDGMPSTKSVHDLLNLWTPAGLIIMEGFDDDRLPPTQAFNRLPVIYLDDARGQPGRNVNFVRHDAQAIVKMAFQEFNRIGYRHFAYIATNRNSHWCEDKRIAYEKLISLTGLNPYVFPPKSSIQKVDSTTIRQLANFLKTLPDKCGILAANDALAMHILAAAKIAKRKIPEELAVVGVDNQPQICEYTKPTLTSIALDFPSAASHTLKFIVNGRNRAHIASLIPPLRLERRGSTAVFPRKDPVVEEAIERIRKEACSGLTARQVTECFPCSRRMAEIRFRAIVGSSILDEIQRIRFEHVVELLRSRNITLEALAGFCGFNSTSLLQRLFKARFGQPIREWQKVHHCTSADKSDAKATHRATEDRSGSAFTSGRTSRSA